MRLIRRTLGYYYALSKEICFLLTHKECIIHIGHCSKNEIMNGNVGDPLLYYELEKLYDTVTGERHNWYHRHINREIKRIEVIIYNMFARAIILGGHGLLMIDTGKNNNSGWQFNIKIENLRMIKKPFAVLAIGYNTFRGQGDFNNAFIPHINQCIKQSVVFGLRNYGSMRALSNYVTSSNKEKICFQPCPTTMLSMYENLKKIEKQKSIGICLAFDRFQNRFSSDFNVIFSKLIEFANHWSSEGYSIQFFVHNPPDLESVYAGRFQESGYQLHNLSGRHIKDVLRFYQEKMIIIGMRGHSLMIPWGLLTPVISLTTQNKQKWFMEITDHDNRSIEVNNPDFLPKLNYEVKYILDNYEKAVDEIKKKQEIFYEKTKVNIMKIEQEIRYHKIYQPIQGLSK